MFSKAGSYFIISISNHTIYYWDKYIGDSSLFDGPIRYLPPADPKALRIIDNSRNRIPQTVKDMLIVTASELAEFESAKTDEELRDFVIRDCKKNDCKLVETKVE